MCSWRAKTHCLSAEAASFDLQAYNGPPSTSAHSMCLLVSSVMPPSISICLDKPQSPRFWQTSEASRPVDTSSTTKTRQKRARSNEGGLDQYCATRPWTSTMYTTRRLAKGKLGQLTDQATFIMPTGNKLPSLLRKPKERVRVEWHRVRMRWQDLKG